MKRKTRIKRLARAGRIADAYAHGRTSARAVAMALLERGYTRSEVAATLPRVDMDDLPAPASARRWWGKERLAFDPPWCNSLADYQRVNSIVQHEALAASASAKGLASTMDNAPASIVVALCESVLADPLAPDSYPTTEALAQAIIDRMRQRHSYPTADADAPQACEADTALQARVLAAIEADTSERGSTGYRRVLATVGASNAERFAVYAAVKALADAGKVVRQQRHPKGRVELQAA